ncbi:hypothetical protein DXG03_009637 [Asterophora parasitica]|uniref:Uncharacterized protein n=1 Tax=Asterophora parasitica TaxID=117018 RepID=A0A9P7K6K2_9AGAR|nr:hypothetical protein DXG03_009637 [Asterophora parasitica]
MLQNPDIQPTTSLNRWIVTVLMFYFELVHIKGDSPPGLEEDEDIFADWVDCMHGFMHIIQPLVPAPSLPPFVLALAGAWVSSEEEGAKNEEDHFAKPRVQLDKQVGMMDPTQNGSENSYDIVPRSVTAIADNLHVDQI